MFHVEHFQLPGRTPPSPTCAGKLAGMSERFGQSYFAQPAAQLGPALLGTIFTRRVEGRIRRARIVEVEAYLGPQDLASHASKGRTPRTEVIFGPPGRAYVYFIYGMHWMFNIVCGTEGEAHAVLVRGAKPLDGWDVNLSGPGRFARAFQITRADNEMDLTIGEIALYPDPAHRPRTVKSKRIGIDYAKRWKDRLLRYVDMNADRSF